MNPIQQRIAIAQACGWTKSPHTPTVWRFNGESYTEDEIPDYPNDLNAMHEAEQHLVGYPTDVYSTQYGRYHSQLRVICNHATYATLVATAAQRAEAFLRTLELWTEN